MAKWPSSIQHIYYREETLVIIILKPTSTAPNPFHLEALFRDQNISAHMRIRLEMGDYQCVFDRHKGGYIVEARPGAEEQVLATAREIGFEPITPHLIAAD